MKLSISSKSKSKCQVFILCLMGEIKRMLTSIIFAVTSDQVKINRSISNSIKGRRIYRSVRFPINQKYDVKMAKQCNAVLYKWNKKRLESLLKDKDSKQSIFYKKIMNLIFIKKQNKAFHPNAKRENLNMGKKIFCFKRTSIDKKQIIYNITNLSSEHQKINLNLEAQPL